MLRHARSLAERSVCRYWACLCGGPVLVVMAYQVAKGVLSWRLVSTLGEPEAVQWDAVLAVVVALAGAAFIVWRHDWWGRWLPGVVAAVVIVACVGSWLQRDRHLQWEGSDVARNNYRAALLALDIGPRKLIATWNARANPYVEPNYMPYPNQVLERIDKLGIGWAIGTRWDRRDLPQDNNRMHMHPPGYPLGLAVWLGLFGRSRLAAMAFEWFLKVWLAVGATLWAWRHIPAEDTLSRAAVSLLLATAPSFLLVIEPHGHELAALLALMAFVLGIEVRGRWRWLAFGLSGVLLAAAAHTNFLYIFEALAVLGTLSVSRASWRRRLPLALAMGAGLVFCVSTVLGYFPWLTYLTGTQVTHYYRLEHPVDTFSAVLDVIYLGFPLLLTAGLGLLGVARLRGEPMLSWMTAAAITLVVGVCTTFGLMAIGRYLVGMFFLLTPLLASTLRSLNLSRGRALVVPLANLAFVAVVLFL